MVKPLLLGWAVLIAVALTVYSVLSMALAFLNVCVGEDPMAESMTSFYGTILWLGFFLIAVPYFIGLWVMGL